MPAGGFELWAWFFMRVSGILLLVLAVVHLVLMHAVIKVENLSFAVVAERWSGPWWRLYDFLLLALALLHGANGLRVVLEEHVRSPGRRLAVKTATAVVAFVLLAMGTYILVTFRPPAA
jgi:succinate dehydrogenase / fumarate reductase membrane anchor subunit